MSSGCYDETLLRILQAEGKIVPFLDVIFGFLHRCTDFYHEHAAPSSVGFPAGVAEQLVVTTFRKWQAIHRSAGAVPPAVAEEQVMTSSPRSAADHQECATGPPAAAAQRGETQTQPPAERTIKTGVPAGSSCSDSYNGAVRDGYSWAQTIGDLTVTVPVPAHVTRGKQVSVEVHSDRVSVRLTGGEPLMSGKLQRTIQPEESTWTLLPGDSVQLSLEKARECWWSSLLEDEQQIDLRQIEAVKPWEDLSEAEQMKVNELRAREEAKRRGAAPAGVATAGGKDVSELLREAWDADGSPFSGQPFDPSTVQIIPNSDPGS